MKFLFFGFSVTEGKNSFAYQIRKIFKDEGEGHSAEICGLGGIQPTYASYILKKVLEDTQYDYVILDIFTSDYRNSLRTRDEYCWPIWHMVETCLRKGAIPILVSFFRKDVDYLHDSFGDAGRFVAKHLNIPFVDVAQTLVHADVTSLFVDQVHPTPQGTKYYLNHILPLVRELIEERKPNLVEKEYLFAENDLFTLDLCTVTRVTGAPLVEGIFERSGFAVSFMKVSPSDQCYISLPYAINVNAVSYLMGPQSSYISLDFGQGEVRKILAFDEFCYYERFHATFIKPVIAESFAIAVDSEVPKIELRKGEKDTSIRVGKVCQLFCSNRSFQEVIQSAKHVWS